MTKIKISETEYYIINIPEEIDSKQLFGIIEKLKRIAKVSGDELMDNISQPLTSSRRVRNSTSSNEWNERRRLALVDKSSAIAFLKEYYPLGTSGMAKKYLTNDSIISNFAYNIRKRFGLTKGVDY